MTSSTFVPSQYHYNERIPEVSRLASSYAFRFNIALIATKLIYSQVVAQTKWVVDYSRLSLDQLQLA